MPHKMDLYTPCYPNQEVSEAGIAWKAMALS